MPSTREPRIVSMLTVAAQLGAAWGCPGKFARTPLDQTANTALMMAATNSPVPAVIMHATIDNRMKSGHMEHHCSATPIAIDEFFGRKRL